MLREMLAIRRYQPADVLALVAKPLQQGPRYGMKVSQIDQRLGESQACRVGGEEIPSVDLPFADIVANELLLDAPCSYEVIRIVHHRNDGSHSLIIRQVTCLGQDNHPGSNTHRLVALGDFSDLVCPEHERAAIDDVALRQENNRVPNRLIGSKLFGGLVHEFNRRGKSRAAV